MILLALLLLSSPNAHAISPATQKIVHDGPAALYNLDYEQSRARIRAFISTEPDNPFGYLFEAGAIWWESSNEYGLFTDTPALEGLFEADVRQAIDKAEVYRQSPDPAIATEGYFVDGMALGTLGEWHLLRHHWIKAYFEGKKAIKELNKTLKIDPGFSDAYLGLGIYDYEADHLPGALKLSSFLMIHGDSKRGLARMRIAADKGKIVSSQAAQYLSSIYLLEEKNYPEALKLLQKLLVQFPGSDYLLFLEATTMYRTGDFDGSYRTIKELADKVDSDPELIGRKQLSLLCGLDGPKCLSAQELSSAIEWLNRAIARAEEERAEKFTALLRAYRGIAYDLAAQHTQAIEDYEQSLAADPPAELENWMKSCLLNQCDRTWVLAHLKKLSLNAPTR